jgi:hypothetical protein
VDTRLFRKVVWVLLIGTLAACKDPDAVSPIPYISFEELEPRIVKAASSEDTAYLRFRFSDGDADLGVPTQSGQYDVFLVDSRDGKIREFLFPEIADELRDPTKGMTGSATIILEAALLIPRDSLHTVLGDTLHYEVYVKDRAGHESNRFITPDIILTPP